MLGDIPHNLNNSVHRSNQNNTSSISTKAEDRYIKLAFVLQSQVIRCIPYTTNFHSECELGLVQTFSLLSLDTRVTGAVLLTLIRIPMIFISCVCVCVYVHIPICYIYFMKIYKCFGYLST